MIEPRCLCDVRSHFVFVFGFVAGRLSPFSAAAPSVVDLLSVDCNTLLIHGLDKVQLHASVFAVMLISCRYFASFEARLRNRRTKKTLKLRVYMANAPSEEKMALMGAYFHDYRPPTAVRRAVGKQARPQQRARGAPPPSSSPVTGQVRPLVSPPQCAYVSSTPSHRNGNTRTAVLPRHPTSNN